MWTVSEDSVTVLQTKLENLWSFLQSKSDLANAHLVDFFTENLWDTLVPKDLQDDLLSLSDSDLASLPSTTALLGGKDERKEITEITDSNQGKNESSASTVRTSSTIPDISAVQRCSEKTVESLYSKYETNSPLEIFRKEAWNHVLSNSGICASLEEVWRTLGVGSKEEDKPRFVKEHMCVKKSHEVEVLSGLVAGLCQACHVDQVVDIGSGKGYLSECLYLQHGLTVLGVDASDTNTHGAKKRSQLLEKQWTGLVNRTRTQATDECQPVREAITVNSKSNAEDTSSDCSIECASGIQQAGKVPAAENQTKSSKVADKVVSSEQGSFTPTTAYINPDTDLVGMVGIGDSVGSPEHLRLLLTGLHTCGDLCPTMLRLFVTCPQATVLCSVGCCYNLLTEQGESDNKDEKCGFPLSQVLRTTGVHLGRTARMLACQAVERMAAEGRLPAMSLFYRALLQVIVRDKFGHVDKEKTVGKVAAKSKDFVDYVRRALRRLQLEGAHLTDEEINGYFEQYKGQLRQLQAFVQLRACLAPCIEAFILLDRLCFLHEQLGVSHAALVPMFDPVISPRCYALVAIKNVVFPNPSKQPLLTQARTSTHHATLKHTTTKTQAQANTPVQQLHKVLTDDIYNLLEVTSSPIVTL